jgi:hypothetical protein
MGTTTRLQRTDRTLLHFVDHAASARVISRRPAGSWGVRLRTRRIGEASRTPDFELLRVDFSAPLDIGEEGRTVFDMTQTTARHVTAHYQPTERRHFVIFLHFMVLGGWGMWLVLACGLASLAQAVSFARKRVSAERDALSAFSRATLMAIPAAISLSLAHMGAKVPNIPELANSPRFDLVVIEGLGVAPIGRTDLTA